MVSHTDNNRSRRRRNWRAGGATNAMSSTLSLRISHIVGLLSVLILALSLDAAENASKLKIVAVEVQPGSPGPNTLCKLRIRFQNSGKDAATDLRFQVTVNEQRLAIYLNHVFRVNLYAGEET